MRKTFYKELIELIKNKDLSNKELTTLKRDLCIKHKLKKIPTNIQVLLNANTKDIENLRKKLLTKPVRSISGVAPIAIMTKPTLCPHGKCIMCPGGPKSIFGDVPQSYTGKEPATMRGIRNHYNAYLQVFNRLQQYAILGHSFEKVELIIMGGTFPAFDKKYQEEFITDAFRAMNDFSKMFFDDDKFNYKKFKKFFELPVEEIGDIKRTARIQKKLLDLKENSNLIDEQTKNETSKVKCVALCIETKPDWGLLVHGNQMLKLGCTRIELGIQSVYEDVIKYINRGHTIQDTINSIQILKDLGFKITGHYMPGLPLTDAKRDIIGLKELFKNPAFRPDMLKLYPTMVSKGTLLYKQYKEGKFKPITANQAAKLIVEFKKEVPKYCRIMRIQRDVPTKQWEGGVEMTNFRQYLHQNYNIKCNCIRCREPKNRKIDWDNVKIKIIEYDASLGKEFFISAEDIKNNIIIGFCRLRFPFQYLRPEITKDSALIRELHVYGTSIPLGKEGSVQHKGWGKKLMQKAQEISKKYNKNKIVVISGIGVRGYYKKIGYNLEGPYMVKSI